MKYINNIVVKIFYCLFLGLLVLSLSGITMVIITKSTDIFSDFPFLKKIYSHLAMIFISIAIILLVNKGSLKEYGFTINWRFPIVGIVVASIIIGVFGNVSQEVIYSILNNSSTTFKPVAGFTLLEKVIYVWLLASIAEEVFTRGLIQGFLNPLKHIGFQVFHRFISLPVIVGAFFFGTMHLMLLSMGVNIYTVLNIVLFGTILGLIAGYYRELTNSLIPAIIVHTCFNIGVSIAQLILK